MALEKIKTSGIYKTMILISDDCATRTPLFNISRKMYFLFQLQVTSLLKYIYDRTYKRLPRFTPRDMGTYENAKYDCVNPGFFHSILCWSLFVTERLKQVLRSHFACQNHGWLQKQDAALCSVHRYWMKLQFIQHGWISMFVVMWWAFSINTETECFRSAVL